MRTFAVARALAALLLAAGSMASAQTPSVVARGGHALVLKSDGTVAAWGNNSDGQLGNGRRLLDPTPTPLPNLPAMAKVASSREHVVALDANGRVWTWGSTTNARLGIRAQRDPAIPGRVQGIQGAIGVAASDFGSFAVLADGSVWMWGGSICGWAPTSPEPRPIAGLANITQISAGQDHVVMRTRAGTVVTLGWNKWGVAGDGTTDTGCTRHSPVEVPGLSNIAFVHAGSFSAHAVTTDGKLYSWGLLWGAAANVPIVTTPTLVSVFAKPVRTIAVREKLFAALNDGTVWLWDTSHDGSPQSIVMQIPGLAAIEELAVPTFFETSVLARDTSGRLFVYSPNNFGEMGTGVTSNITPVATQVPLPTAVRTMSVGFYGVTAITADGATWTWGRDGLGVLGRGGYSTSAVPLPVPSLTHVRKLSVGSNNSFALDATGTVWGWGRNTNSELGTQGKTPSSVPVQINGVSGVADIAASWSALLMLGSDGKVRTKGAVASLSSLTTPIEGLPPIARLGAGSGQAFFITASGELWALGPNSFGQLGDGTTTDRTTPVKIAGIPPVSQVVSEFSFTMALTTNGEVWIWGNHYPGLGQGQGSLVPLPLAGLSGIAEIATGLNHALARRSDGTVLSWSSLATTALGRAGDPVTPLPVEGLDQVISIAAADFASFAIRADGTVWGWGGTTCASDGCPTTGDGALVSRGRPVVVIRENGAGNLSTNDWFLDAKPGAPKTIPAAKIPKLISVAQALSTSGLLNVDASVNVRQSDQAKTLGLYVTGLVPAAFLKQVPTAAGAQAKVAGMKADQMVLVNLTPSGWTVASGQLQALQTGAGNAMLGASSLLVNVNPATIPGARFCIGYGESASDMLAMGTIRDFLSLEGAASSAFGLPCLLSGVYMEGPHSSPKGSAVPIRAVVVGQGPTGTVRFKERFTEISGDVAITPVNSAVADARFSYTPPGAGEFAFAAAYGGDGANAASSSEIPLRHVVRAVQSGTVTKIDAPVTSEVGMEVRLIASVTGNRPGGTVQFKRGAVNEGAPVPVIDDQAVVSVVGLGIGEVGFTAGYSGDASNQASTSTVFAHKVLDVATSAVSLGSSANPVTMGATVKLTATASGSDPTGVVTLREGAEAIATANLAAGMASFDLASLGAGVHVFTADYAGDAKNPAATSNAVFQQVSLGSPFDANVRSTVTGYYQKILGRTPDTAGLDFWAAEATRVVALGADVREVFFAMSIAFFASPEYAARATSDAQFVTDLYRTFFDRAPDVAGLAYWQTELGAVGSRSALLNSFLFSAEFSNQMTALFGASSVRSEVTMTIDLFRGTLGRLPDSAGFSFWLGRIRSAQCQGAAAVTAEVNSIAGQFFNGGEYLARSTSNRDFTGDVYNAYLRRGPGGDSGGFNHWVGQVATLGRDGVRAQFVPSAEFQNRVMAVVDAGCVQ